MDAAMSADSSMSTRTADSSQASGDRRERTNSDEDGKYSGDVVDDYELIRVLGKGHFATVRLARRFETGRMCALKMIEYNRGSERQKELFRREVAAMMAVRHVNVVELRRVVQAAEFENDPCSQKSPPICDTTAEEEAAEASARSSTGGGTDSGDWAGIHSEPDVGGGGSTRGGGLPRGG